MKDPTMLQSKENDQNNHWDGDLSSEERLQNLGLLSRKEVPGGNMFKTYKFMQGMD